MEAFKTNKTLKDQVASLQSELQSSNEANDLQTEQLETAHAEIVTKDETIATLTAEKGTLEDSLTESTESLATANTDLATAATDLEASKAETVAAEASAEAKAVEIAAAAGHKPNVIPEKENEGATEMTRAEFDKLTPSAKSQFSINGGKIK